MNTLVLHIAKHRLDFVKVMNALQRNGIVSDNCVNAKSVAHADIPRAIEAINKWLPKHEKDLQ